MTTEQDQTLDNQQQEGETTSAPVGETTTAPVGETTTAAAPALTGNAEPMIPKTRFDEVNKKLKKFESDLKKAEADRVKAEEQALAEQGEFKKLYEAERAKAEEAAAAIKSLQHDELRRQVATAAGHPQLWNRISGDTQEDLEADMNSLVEVIPGMAFASRQ